MSSTEITNSESEIQQTNRDLFARLRNLQIPAEALIPETVEWDRFTAERVQRVAAAIKFH